MKRVREEACSAEEPGEKLSSECFTVVARLYQAWLQRGESMSDFLSFLSEAGYELPERTLMNWSRGLREDGVALSGGEKRGRKQLVTEEEKRWISGFTFDRQQTNQKTILADLEQFCRDELEKDMSHPTLSRLMAELGFASRKMQVKTSGFQVDMDSATDLSYEWLQKNHKDFKRHKLWSVDCFFTGHRTDTHSSFVVSGGPPANFSAGFCSYTALGVTCVCADGRYYESIVYSANPIFNRNVNPTARRLKIWAEVDAVFKKWGVAANRVTFVTQEEMKGKNGKGTKKSIVPAHTDRIRDYFSRYVIEDDCIILSDGGDEFTCLAERGFSKHIHYPGPVHQWLSPNDNRLHGTAKQRWRKSGVDFKNDAEALASLLYFMDDETKNAEKWFDANLQVDQPSVTRERVESIIRGKKHSKNRYYVDARKEYLFKFRLDPRGEYDDRLPDDLDGLYWT